jgi:hypothetical protein
LAYAGKQGKLTRSKKTFIPGTRGKLPAMASIMGAAEK